jgi:hypothetical protein
VSADLFGEITLTQVRDTWALKTWVSDNKVRMRMRGPLLGKRPYRIFSDANAYAAQHLITVDAIAITRALILRLDIGRTTNGEFQP